VTDGPAPGPARPTTSDRVLLAVTVAVQLVVLYAPQAPATPSTPGIDKVVHAAVFGAVAWAAVRCGFPARWVAAVLVAHAALSEVVQHLLLAQRSGDPLDALADTIGVALGLALGRRSVRRRQSVRRRPARTPPGARRV
jgi:hypothetical protein